MTSSFPTLSSHPSCPPLLRQTAKRACLYGDPKGPASISGGGGGRWGEPRGQNSMCAVPGPLSGCNPGTDEPLFLLKLSFHSPTAMGCLRWGCSGVGRGWLSDFNDIDGHFSIVKKPHNSFDNLYRAIGSPPSQVSDPRGLLRTVTFGMRGGRSGALCGSHTAAGHDIQPHLVRESKSAAWLKTTAYNDSLFDQFSLWGNGWIPSSVWLDYISNSRLMLK